MKPTVIEAGTVSVGNVRYRFTCQCGARGSWTSLNDAEREAAKHDREKHAEVASA